MKRLILASLILQLISPSLFRRAGNKPTRDEAFEDLFNILARIYDLAARLKPEWRAEWGDRSNATLPPRYAFGDPLATAAAQDMRFATALLHRNRWKSKVQPLFDSFDTASWSAFQGVASNLSVALLDVAVQRSDLLLADERDWIAAAIEQLDAASKRRRDAERANEALPTLVAEGSYQVLYIAIQLSERLIERRRFETQQRR